MIGQPLVLVVVALIEWLERTKISQPDSLPFSGSWFDIMKVVAEIIPLVFFFWAQDCNKNSVIFKGINGTLLQHKVQQI